MADDFAFLSGFRWKGAVIFVSTLRIGSSISHFFMYFLFHALLFCVFLFFRQGLLVYR